MFTVRFLPLLALLVSLAPASAAPRCDHSGIDQASPTLPQTGTAKNLPSPPSDVTLKRIALGFGIQNYTCDGDGATAAAHGALAMLYDIAQLYPDQGPESLSAADFANLSAHALRSHPVPLNLDSESAAAAAGSRGASQTRPFPVGAPLRLGPGLPPLPFLGHHFFDSQGIPTFVLDDGRISLPTTKLDGVAAPADADAGPDGTGAVAWLYLGPKQGAHGAKYVYRVLTAGGRSHGCSSGTADDSSSYAATYWFYG